MRLRSLLFVPGDRPDRFDKAMNSGADAVIFDLEDSVAPDRKGVARDAVAAALGSGTALGCLALVRVNPIGSAWLEDDLAAIGAIALNGVMLPKAEGAGSIERLSAECPLPILPITTETPRAVFALGQYQEVAARLLALTWGAEDLSAAVGASASRDGSNYLPPYAVARSLALFAAAAAGVPAIETVYPDLRDLEGLSDIASAAARDGFDGMMAIHPAQVPIINEAFHPSAAALAQARRVIEAFAAKPGAGALQIDGKMIDAPHIRQATRILERART